MHAWCLPIITGAAWGYPKAAKIWNCNLYRICKPGDKLHVVWVTTTGGDYDDAALQTYKDAMHEAKVHPSWQQWLL